jgi:hypothetical protein
MLLSQAHAELEADAFPPLMTVAESASFDASGSTGDIAKYQWQFCDGDRWNSRKSLQPKLIGKINNPHSFIFWLKLLKCFLLTAFNG